MTEMEELDIRIEDPVTDTTICLVGGLLGLGPVVLDRLDEALLGLLGALLSTLCGLVTLEHQVVLERLCVPVVVGGDDIALPVGLDQILELLTIGGLLVGDAVIRQPSLELRLVPLAVD